MNLYALKQTKRNYAYNLSVALWAGNPHQKKSSGRYTKTHSVLKGLGV